MWLGRNILGSCYAVKIVYRGSFDREKPCEQEFAGICAFEKVSRSHESQMGILQVGRNDQEGYFYYVMDLADAGRSRFEDAR